MEETATAPAAETTPPPAESAPAAASDPVTTEAPPPPTATEGHTLQQEKLDSAEMAKMDDSNALFFGIVPLVIIGVLALGAAALYFARRGKNWNELSDSMRIDDGDKPVTSDESFNTRDISEMEATKPSQRITELSRHQSKSE